MARTIGIIVSAVIVFIAGLIAFLLGTLTIVLAIAEAFGAPSGRGMSRLFAIPVAIAMFGLGGWGVASGLGLARLREWARISMLALAAILIALAAFGALEMVLDPYAGVSSMEGVYLGSLRPDMFACLAGVAALGGFWLVFFSRTSVKSRFSR